MRLPAASYSYIPPQLPVPVLRCGLPAGWDIFPIARRRFAVSCLQANEHIYILNSSPFQSTFSYWRLLFNKPITKHMIRTGEEDPISGTPGILTVSNSNQSDEFQFLQPMTKNVILQSKVSLFGLKTSQHWFLSINIKRTALTHTFFHCFHYSLISNFMFFISPVYTRNPIMRKVSYTSHLEFTEVWKNSPGKWWLWTSKLGFTLYSAKKFYQFILKNQQKSVLWLNFKHLQ